MGNLISVVINTLNEEKNIKRALESVKWADEVMVCDMHSEDKTVDLAGKMGAKIITHDRTGYVEPARNFAISKASGEWVLVLDADEEIPLILAEKLQQIAKEPLETTFVEIPRKNIIFNKWMEASFWWPDYNIRFFKKGSVTWSNKIHSKPVASGQGLTLPAEEPLAIIHYNYTSVTQFIERMNRYSDIQAKHLFDEGIKFKWINIIDKPLSEFLSRFFANRGYEDGLHGLSLSLLQACSFLLVYLKLWEKEGFEKQDLRVSEVQVEVKKVEKELNYWFKFSQLSKNPLKKLLQKMGGRI